MSPRGEPKMNARCVLRAAAAALAGTEHRQQEQKGLRYCEVALSAWWDVARAEATGMLGNGAPTALGLLRLDRD